MKGGKHVKKRILKIAGIIVGVLILWRIVSACLFVTVGLGTDTSEMVKDKYSSYFLNFRDWSSFNGWEHSSGSKAKIWRWKREELEHTIIENIKQELEVFCSMNKNIYTYTFDEKRAEIYIYYFNSEDGKIQRYLDQSTPRFHQLCFFLRNVSNDIPDSGEEPLKLISNLNKEEISSYSLREYKEIISSNRSKGIEITNPAKYSYVEWELLGSEYRVKKFKIYDFEHEMKEVIDFSQFKILSDIELQSTQIKKVIFPKSIRKIKRGILICKNMEEIEICDGIKIIENHAFADCECLKKVKFAGDAPKKVGEDIFGEVSDEFVIYYKKGTKGWDDKYWKRYNLKSYDTNENGEEKK